MLKKRKAPKRTRVVSVPLQELQETCAACKESLELQTQKLRRINELSRITELLLNGACTLLFQCSASDLVNISIIQLSRVTPGQPAIAVLPKGDIEKLVKVMFRKKKEVRSWLLNQLEKGESFVLSSPR